MTKYTWDTDCTAESNVSVNDGVVTYYAEWDTADDERSIDLQEVAADFADGYDHNGEPGPVSITVTNLITGEDLENEIEPEDDENDDEDGDADDEDADEDADEDGEDGDADEDEDDVDADEDDADADDDTEDEGARAALWHGEIDFLDGYQPPGRRGR